ncbi:protein ralf-like 34 [Phtheirospermum japonicum]|uniref:Protein ralf-like 34 n=1 Tax=Phtheirospermum japonicum TaxID=374723 RepID=A0A830B6A7_9LAMI|nr:protein ralf-like 34 [Phtheirospermum japonicum]
MAAKLLFIPIFFLFIILLTLTNTKANVKPVEHNAGLGLINETLNRQFQAQYYLEPEDEDEDEDEDGLPRRSLYWKASAPRRYYISYGALSANRVPCPARSGRSYYTHNCFRAQGPVNPYSRGCSSVTRCRR